MNQTLSNSRLTVEVNGHGAELCSLRGADCMEYLWQGDPKVWGRHAPVLFPIVGKLAGDRYQHGGHSYVMKQHGFARDLDFELSMSSPTQLSFQLSSTPETRRQYPFEFQLVREYRLEGAILHIHNTIVNSGTNVMPFSIGEHPGFALTWGSGDQVEDYALEFEKEEPLVTRLLDAAHLISSTTEPVATTGRILPLRRDLFDRDALIFFGLQSTAISLCSHKHRRRLTVGFAGFPAMGIWAKPGAPFVCVEPWHGHADTSSHDGVLLNKPGIIRLNPGEPFRCGWSVHVADER